MKAGRFLIGALIGAVIGLIFINWSLAPDNQHHYNAGHLTSFPEIQYYLAPVTWPLTIVSTDVISQGWSSDCEMTGFPVELNQINLARLAIIIFMAFYFGSLALIRGKSKDELLVITIINLLAIFFSLALGLNFFPLYFVFTLFNCFLIFALLKVKKLKKPWRITLFTLIPILLLLVNYLLVFAIVLDYQC